MVRCYQVTYSFGNGKVLLRNVKRCEAMVSCCEAKSRIGVVMSGDV